MIRDYNLWFQSLPVFLNQTPRDINSFLSNEKFDDDLFLPCCNSLLMLVYINKYKKIMI